MNGPNQDVSEWFEMIESVSRRAFITSSGSYNVRASEQAKERRHKTLSAVVLFLDDSQHTFQIDVSNPHQLNRQNDFYEEKPK